MRIALIERHLVHFPATAIRLLLADRAFVGAEWMEFLCKNNVSFAIRVGDNLRITTEDGHDPTLRARLHQARRGRTFRARLGTREDAAASNAPLLTIAAKPLRDDWLIAGTNVAPHTAIETCRKRWATESLFGDARTRGLDLKDTRLTDPRKLAVRICLVALALAWAGRAAAGLLGNRAPPRKSQGHDARSWFRTGFDHIRNRLGSDPLDAIASWQGTPQKHENTAESCSAVATLQNI